MTDRFWKNAADSLPPEVRWRYARLFEAAEKYEPLLDILLAAGGHARRALAQTCSGAAEALRTAARMLDVAARRLNLTR